MHYASGLKPGVSNQFHHRGICRPGGIQTPTPWIRSPVHYSVMLQVYMSSFFINKLDFLSRPTGTQTPISSLEGMRSIQLNYGPFCTRGETRTHTELNPLDPKSSAYNQFRHSGILYATAYNIVLYSLIIC